MSFCKWVLFNYISVDGLRSFGGSVVKQSKAMQFCSERERERNVLQKETKRMVANFREQKRDLALIYREN